MNSKYLDEQYTPDIVFLFCTALFFILMFLIVTPFLLKMSADFYVSQCFQLCSSSYV